MNLKPQDLLIALKLLAAGNKHEWRFNGLSLELCLSVSETHAGMKRAQRAGLVYASQDRFLVSIRATEEFLLHGLRYVFVPELGELTRGMPTAYAASPIATHIVTSAELPPVWPTPDGSTRGLAFSPLYKSAPKAAARDADLYELLVIADSLRAGRARERKIAETELKKRLVDYDRR